MDAVSATKDRERAALDMIFKRTLAVGARFLALDGTEEEFPFFEAP